MQRKFKVMELGEAEHKILMEGSADMPAVLNPMDKTLNSALKQNVFPLIKKAAKADEALNEALDNAYAYTREKTVLVFYDEEDDPCLQIPIGFKDAGGYGKTGPLIRKDWDDRQDEDA